MLEMPMPEGVSRVESGAIRFGDDWPCLHLRGDDAFLLAVSIGAVLAALEGAAPSLELTVAARVLGALREQILSEVVEGPRR